MIAETGAFFVWLLGLDEDTLSVRHMVARAVVVFAFALMIVRFGNKRFIGANTAFDVILGVMLGSVISRAITGQSPFVPTLCAALVLVALHGIFANVAVRFDPFGTLVKGSARRLIQDGKVDWDAMRRSNLSRDDLLEALRLRAGLQDLEKIKEARLERNGEISFIRHDE
ncbi:DUF421 domain-containing protein [Yoonia sp.]|uniref:DUF421 domain-containing protein n=1 Tax=Yoonia sp. TaxID=2212373 RepID=UPI0039195FEA